jgi:hypothetical protein
MARLAQDFTIRYPWWMVREISAVLMVILLLRLRYTEAKLDKFSMEMQEHIVRIQLIFPATLMTH